MVGKIVIKQFNLDEYLKNSNRKVITRDGHDVRIVCTDCRAYEYPIVALVTYDNYEFVVNCTKEGKCNIPSKYKYDLFFAAEKKNGWVNLYKSGNNVIFGSNRPYNSEELAKDNIMYAFDYLTTIKIDWEE